MDEQVVNTVQAELPEATIEVMELPATQPEPAESGTASWLIWGIALVLAILAVVVAALLRRQSSNRKKPQPEPLSTNGSETEPVNSLDRLPKLTVVGAQTIGAREDQEDAFSFSDYQDARQLTTYGFYAAVSDGIGGLDDGQVASHAAMRVMQTFFRELPIDMRPSDKLLNLATAAHREVRRLNQEGTRCGATLVSVLLSGWDMWLLSIGDSHIYLCRAGTLLLLNRSHTYGNQAEEMSSLAGATTQIDPKRGRALTSYLGQENLSLIDRTAEPTRLQHGDSLLLMSDGVFGTLSEDEIVACLRQDPAGAANAIVAAVDAKGVRGQDNATVIVINID